MALGFLVNLGISVGSNAVLNVWNKPTIPPAPKPATRLELASSPMRYILGKRRVEGSLVFATGIYRRGTDRDPAYAWLIYVLGEGAMEGIEEIYINGDILPFTRNGGHLTPSDGRYQRQAGAPAPAIEIFEYFDADGTQGVDMRTPTAPAGRQYGNSRIGPWSSAPDARTLYYRDPIDAALGLYSEPFPYSAEAKTWGTAHRLDGLSYVGVKLFQNYYNVQDRNSRVWQKVPKIEFVVKGKKLTWPGQTTPKYTENPIAWLYWYDTVRRGIPASRIDTPSFTESFNKCDEDVTIPLSRIPASHRYLVNVQGTGRTTKRYFGGLEVLSGLDSAQFYSWIEGCCLGYRFQDGGNIHYRVDYDRASSLTVVQDDFVAAPQATPWPAVDERINDFNATLTQSQRNGFNRDTVALRDASAVVRDTKVLSLDVQVEGVYDEIVAARLLYIRLRHQRQSLVITGTVGRVTGLNHLKALPGDAWTVTLPLYGVFGQKMEVIEIKKSFLDGTAEVRLKLLDTGIYADTLVLPELTGRPVRFSEGRQAPDVTGLTASGYVVTQSDGSRLNHMAASWEASAALFTEARYRESALFDVRPNDAAGIQATYLGIRPFGIGASRAAGIEFVTPQVSRHGLWFNNQWSPLWNDGNVRGARTEDQVRSRALQMQIGADGNVLPILGLTDSANRAAVIWRFGVTSAGRVTLGFNARSTATASVNATVNFSATQITNWKIVGRDTDGNTFSLSLPTTAQDATEPYIWEAGAEGLAAYAFALAASTNSRRVDIAFIDTSKPGVSVAAATAARDWSPMPRADLRAEATGILEAVLHEIEVRHGVPEAAPGDWAQTTFVLTGDVTPPGIPTGLDLTLLPRGFFLEFTPPDDMDIAYYQIGVGDTATVTPVVGESIRGHWISPSTYAAGVTKFLRVRAVDRRGNIGGWSGAVSGPPLDFPAAAGGGQIYFIDIPSDVANPTPGSTALVGGGTLPAAAAIIAGSVAIDTSDGRLWEWNATTMAFSIRTRVKGGDFQVADTRPAVCVPHQIRMDGDGSIWQCNAAGNGEVFTGARVPLTGGEPLVDSQGRQIWITETWSPGVAIGKAGDGAYTPDGKFGVRGSGGWPSLPDGTFGAETDSYSVFTIASADDLPDYPLIPAGGEQNIAKIHIRIAIDTGFIYKWSGTTGNWTKIGELFGSQATIDFPRNASWTPPTANAMGGLFTSTFSWSPVAGASFYEVDLIPDTASRVGQVRVDGTSLIVTDLPAAATTFGYVRAVNADGLRSAQSNANVSTTGAAVVVPSAPTAFSVGTINAVTGDVPFTWGLPTTNSGVVGSWILEMRQGGSLYQRIVIAGRSTLAHTVRAVPSGTYSASLTAQGAGGPGPAANITSLTVPTRVQQTYPPPRQFLASGVFRATAQTLGYANARIGTENPTAASDISWQAGQATGSAPSGVYIWCPSGKNANVSGSPGFGVLTGPSATVGSSRRYWLYGVTTARRVVFRAAHSYADGNNSPIVQSIQSFLSGASGTTPAPVLHSTSITQSDTVNGRIDVGVIIPAVAGRTTGYWISLEVIAVTRSDNRVIQTPDGPLIQIHDLTNFSAASVTRYNFNMDGVGGRDAKLQVRLYSVLGQSAAAEQNFTFPRVGVPIPPDVTGLGTANKTATGIRITGPSAFPRTALSVLRANAVQWYLARHATPNIPLTAFPITAVGSIPWPQDLTGIPTNDVYTYHARYRNGTSALDYQYSVGWTTVDFQLGTPVAPSVTGLGTRGRTATGITITGPSAFAAGANAAEWYVALASSPNSPLAAYPRTTVTSAPWPQNLTGLTTNQNYVYRARYRGGLSSGYVWSDFAEVAFTLGTPRAPTPPNVTGLGQTSKTTTGITITGPSSFPANANAVEDYVALESSPGTPLSTHPRRISTSIPWPRAITGLTPNTNYVYIARYRNGTAAPYAFSPSATSEEFTLGTPARPPPIVPIPVPPAPASISIVVSTTVRGSGQMTCPDTGGATRYRWTIVSRAAGSTFRRVINTNTRRADFSGLANGQYSASVQAGNVAGVFGTSSPSGNFTIAALTPPATPALAAPSSLIMSATWTRSGGVYVLTAGVGAVPNAATYHFEFLYDLFSNEFTDPGEKRTGLRADTVTTPSRIAQLSSSTHMFVDGRTYYCDVRGVKSDGSVGPPIVSSTVVFFPSQSVTGSSNVVNVRSISITDTSVRVAVIPVPGVTSYRYPADLARSARLGGHDGILRSIRYTGLRPARIYSFVIQVEGSSTNARTRVTFRTLDASSRRTTASGSSGATGQAEGPSGQAAAPARQPEHYEMSYLEPPDPLVPEPEVGEVGDTCTLLDDGSHWRKTEQGWQPTVIPHEG